MDPSKNIYPHHSYFCKHLQIKDRETTHCMYNPEYGFAAAIFYLQVDRVNELLTKISEEKLLLVKCEPITKTSDLNILEKICICQQSTGHHIDVNTLHRVARADMFSATKTIETIVHLLLKKQPKLITPKCFDFAQVTGKDNLIKIMMQYEETDFENVCYICHSGACSQTFLSHICECKMPIHFMCLEILLKTSDGTCKTCKTRFRLNESRTCVSNADIRIFSPFDDFYPQMFSKKKYVSIQDKPLTEKLYWAVCYLQIRRVINLLSEFSKEYYKGYIMNIISGRNRSSPFQTIKLDKDGNIEMLELMEVLPTNYSKIHNYTAHKRIETMLNDKIKK